MSTTVNLTSSYSGAVAGGYITQAFLANETIKHITLKENIPFTQAVRRAVDNASTFDARTCDFTPGGQIDFSERILTLTPLSWQRQLCIDTWLEDWEALAAQNDNINSVLEAVEATAVGKIAEINEPMIWTGDSSNATSTTAEYDGFLKLFTNDIAIGTVPNAVPLTASNIIAKIQDTITAMPTRVKRASDKPVLYMSQYAWEMYMYAQVGAGFATYLTNGPAVNPTFMGLYSIAVCPGLPDNVMVFAQPSNLWFGTNKTLDYNSLNIADMTPWNEKNVRIRADFYAAVQYGFSDEIVTYGLAIGSGS